MKRRKRRRLAVNRVKCPRCWAEKAYRRKVKGWRRWLYDLLLMEPMKCHHCYHKFTIFWFTAIGKQLDPPLRPDHATESPPAAQPAWTARTRPATDAEPSKPVPPQRVSRVDAR